MITGTDAGPAADAGRATPPRAPERRDPGALRRAGLAGTTAFLTANIWTGCPLLALWIGAQVVGEHALSMGAVCVVVVALAVLVFGSTMALTWLNNVYDEIVGRPRAERRSTWLRSMRGESEGHVSQRVGVTLLERIVVINVYVAVIAFVVWYVTIAGRPTPILCGISC